MLVLVLLSAVIGMAASQATPAPTFTGHQQLFDKIRYEENKTREITWDHVEVFEQNITTWIDTLIRVFCENRDALMKWDVNGSTGQPRLIVMAGSQLSFLDPITGDTQSILDSVLILKNWSQYDVAWNDTHDGSPRQFNVTDGDDDESSSDSLSTSDAGGNNLRPPTAPLFDDEDGKVALAQIEAAFPSYYRQIVADLFAFINAPGVVTASDPAIYRTRFLSRLAADLYGFEETHGSITGQCSTQGINYLNDTDGSAYDVDRGRLYYTSRLQNSSDHIGNSCQLRYLDVDTCTDVGAADFNGHWRERHFVNDTDYAYTNEICKLPGLAWAPKPDPRLYAVTYYCDILVFNTSAGPNPDTNTENVTGTGRLLRALVNESDPSAPFPSDWRCERSGMAYDCLHNVLYLIVQPTDDSPVLLVSIDPSTGLLLNPPVETDVAAVVGDLYGEIPDELEQRVGYGLTSSDCYRMNFVMDAMDWDFNLTRKALWMDANVTTEALKDGLARIDNATFYWGNQTVKAIWWDGNETRLAIDEHMVPLLEFLDRTNTTINSTATMINFLHGVLSNVTGNITALGPQVDLWISAFQSGASGFETLAYEELKDVRETLLARLDSMRDELEHRHAAIIGCADEIQAQVGLNGGQIDVQLRRLMNAYSDNSRWSDDDDDDNGFRSEFSTSDFHPERD